MDKKYILTEETKEVNGHILHRIQALRDFSDVKAGELGGWIESEGNLFHDGNCWVYDNAMVFGDARVYGNAEIFGRAKIYGNIEVYGNAKIYGNVEIYGNAKIYGNVEIYGNAKIYGGAEVYENVEIYGNAEIYGNVEIYGGAEVCRCTKINGNAKISSNADIRHFRHYLCLGPIGSRNDYTTFYHTKDNDIWVCCGCFSGSIDSFKQRVTEIHENDVFAQQYLLACQIAELNM